MNAFSCDVFSGIQSNTGVKLIFTVGHISIMAALKGLLQKHSINSSNILLNNLHLHWIIDYFSVEILYIRKISRIIT